ncbi:protein adenylyltransferase SelO [Bdellovibrio bacteriovorus]|uniref:protein adenylyltransferase SelO n=1 Tax=Bdellovibrio bacteriovorus TaxID=959 RepID=UPI0035A9936E
MSSSFSPPIYELGPDFYDEVLPARFPKAILRYRNQSAAKQIALDQLSDEQWQKHFWAFESLPGNVKTPLALRYHGHQFQTYNPQLGDGRGFLFAQFQTPTRLLDLGTKGSGQTPYSRNGDGRLTLKGAFREILATELLESYGVNTSKTFSVFETGESLERHDEPSPTRAGVLVRLSHSHIRFGTFQRLAFLQQSENIKKLVAYCVKHFYPSLSSYQDQEQAAMFLQAVSQSSARLVASWMMAGFVHGVLNTDNMNITGESFDYGPYRFLPTYDPNFTAAYFDHSGLYCFGRQPASVLWNLYQLGGALKVAYPDLPLEELLDGFGDDFNYEIHQQLLKRLNLRNPLQEPSAIQELNVDLVSHLFQFMEKEKCLFEQTIFDLHSGGITGRLGRSPQGGLYQKESFKALQDILECFEIASEENAQHPYFQQPKACALLIDELESLWKPIADNDDWAPFEEKLAEIRSFRGVYS